MSSIKQTGGPSQVHCGPNDKTAPPQPQITRSMAFDRAKEGSSVGNNNTSGVSSGKRDPVYIELANVEIGTTIEIINFSANPNANFNDKDKIAMKLTGRDVQARTGSLYLTQQQMEKLGLKAGDMYKLRAVDEQGNPSLPTTGELEPQSWANAQVIEDGRWSNVRGAQINALDGEGERKPIIAKAVNDARPPMVLEDRVSIDVKGNGQKDMLFDQAIEPRSTVSIQNSRTNATFSGRVDDDGKLTIALKAIEEGDPLLVSVTDNNGVRGKDFEIVFSSKCKDGKAPKLKGGLSARLPGVI